MGQNNTQIIIFLIIVGISFLNWAIGQAKEKREIKRINEQRRRQRAEAAGEDTETAPSNTLAEQRRERLRQLRKQQAQRTREQINVLTGKNAPKPAPKPVKSKRPFAPPPIRTSPTQTQQPQRSQRGVTKRPVRPGRTARRTPPPQQPQPRPQRRQPEPPMPKPAPGHSPLPSEEVGVNEIGTGRATTTPEPVRVEGIDWRQAIILSEILAPPVSMRKPDDR